MKTTTLIIILFLDIVANGQTVNWSWANSYGKYNFHEYNNAMCTDRNGNSYFTGTFQDSLIIGIDTLIRTGSSGWSIYLAKIDSSGNPLWAISPTGNNYAEVFSIVLDSLGRVYVTGAFNGTLKFGSDSLYSNGIQDVFIVKFDVNGNTIWTNKAGDFGQCIGYGIAVNPNSEVYITGTFDSSITFGSIHLQGNSGSSIFITKCDSSGNYLWAHATTGTINTYSNGITCDMFDHVCITGYFHNTITFGSYTLTGSVNGSAAVFTVKYDSAGNVLWAKSSGGFPSSGYTKSISSDAVGNFYCAGYFDSQIMIFGNDTLTNAGLDDLFVVKYDSNGNLKWARRAGGIDHDRANVIKTDNAGNSYVAGFFKGFIDFGSINLQGANQEIFVTKYDSNGNTVWAISATGTLNETGEGVGFDNFNNVYVSGNFTSPSTTFGTHPVVNTDQFTGTYNIFIACVKELPTIIEYLTQTKESLLFYPNPGDEFIELVNEYETNSVLSIYDVEGRVFRKQILNNEKIIGTKSLPKGVYFIQINGGKKILNGKIIISR